VLNLHVVQAEYGDCFILESKQGKESTAILIDGGPYQTFEKHLKPTFQKLPTNRKLDLVVLSHIDNDHIIGLLDLLDEIKSQREKGKKELIKVYELWHNSFNDILRIDVEPFLFFKNIYINQNLISKKEEEKNQRIISSIIMKGFQQGKDLALLAKTLKISINPRFNKLVVVDEIVKSIHLKNITIRILGPTRKNLEKLRQEWKDWFTKKKQIQNVDSDLLQILDTSVPNLSSIMFLAEIQNKKLLFTGDGSGEDVIRLFSKNEMLDEQGKMHVDVLKVPHHGSDRNVSKEFFNTINSHYYVISANGRDDNPSLATLRWIIESGQSKNLKKIVLTNKTPNVLKILKEYDQKKFNYECSILEKKEDFFTIYL
jgi:beta-lactamase superfamily II metal-dependent hydrolase